MLMFCIVLSVFFSFVFALQIFAEDCVLYSFLSSCVSMIFLMSPVEQRKRLGSLKMDVLEGGVKKKSIVTTIECVRCGPCSDIRDISVSSNMMESLK